MNNTEERLSAMEEEQRRLSEWLFNTAPGDEESRADIIMSTCRDWRATQSHARLGVRISVAVLGVLGGWYAFLGEFIAKISKAG